MGFFEARVRLCRAPFSSFDLLLSCSPFDVTPDDAEDVSRLRLRDDDAEESEAEDMVELLSDACLNKIDFVVEASYRVKMPLFKSRFELPSLSTLFPKLKLRATE